jgi:hypothetical protein
MAKRFWGPGNANTVGAKTSIGVLRPGALSGSGSNRLGSRREQLPFSITTAREE